MTDGHGVWSVEDDKATLRCGALEAKLALTRTQDGIGVSWYGQTLQDVRCLRIANELTLVDHHIRGCDLVANYRQTKGSYTTPQVYWRSLHQTRSDACGIELVLSVQTDLLDSSPLCSVCSEIPCNELLHSASLDASGFTAVDLAQGHVAFFKDQVHLLLARLDNGLCSYAQLVHPADFDGVEIDHGVRIRTSLFHEHLEKGVIRRGRVCGWFMPVENDRETAVVLAREFVEEPLPLTA